MISKVLKKTLDYILPLVILVACTLSLLVSDLIFWFFVPLVLAGFLWRKYKLSIIVGSALYLFIAGYLMWIFTGNMLSVSFHFSVLGALIGVASYGERAVDVLKKKWFGENGHAAVLKKIASQCLVYLVIAIFVIIVGAYLGALIGAPIGDDAYVHVGKALFVRNNFPNINWYPNWYLGLDMFQTYPPAYYFIVALANLVTGVSITELVVVFFFFSMFLLGAAVYKLSKDMGLPRYLSLGFSLAWLSLPIVWGETITGGAYLRSFAAPLYVLSIVAAYTHVKSINKGKNSRKAFFSLVFLLSFAALLHEMVGFFAVVTVFLIYLLAVRGLKQKLKTILMIFVPVVGLISWWYLPLISHQISYPSLALNDLTLDSFSALSTSLTPIFMPLFLFLSCIFIFALLKNKQVFNASYEKKAFLIVFGLLSLYFVLFACFPMPANWYLMAAYDYAIWFGISLVLFVITLSSLFCVHFENIPSNKLKCGLKAIPKILSIILALLIITSFIVSLPIIYPSNVNPDNPNDWVHGLNQDLGYINNTSSDNFRLAVLTRRVYAMNQYSYPEIEFTGGRQLGSYHAYYDDIFDERVLLRYHEDESIHIEEALSAHSTVPYPMDNYYSSMFWMDWYGANGVLAASFEQSLQTYNGYYERPQFYNATTFSDGSTYITYNGSSPILVSTNAPVVGVIGDDATYNALFQTLGELDINSQTVIPVKLETANLQQNLQFINTVFVNSDQFQTYQTTLENYAKNGGNLVIMNNNPESTTLENANLTQSGLTFSTYALPLTNIDNSSRIIATTNQGPVISRSTLGTGFITKSSISLQELYQDASPVASAVLAVILLPNFNIAAFTAGNINVNSTVNAVGSVTTLNNQEMLEGKISPNGQVIYTIPFEKQISSSAVGLVQFQIWGDGQLENMVLNLVDSGSNASLTYSFPDSQWTGWKTFSIPLAAFVKEQGNSILDEFDRINLVLTNSGNTSISEENYALKMQNIHFYEIASNSTYISLTSNWTQPNLLQVSLESRSSPTHLLWKESYAINWQITTNPKTTNTASFYAGPGVMLVCIPSNVSNLQFFLPLSHIQDIGITVSIITFIALVIIGTQQKRLSKSLKFSH